MFCAPSSSSMWKRKIIDFGMDFGAKNASGIDKNGSPKMDPKSIASWKQCLSIFNGFGEPGPRS